MSSRWVPCFCYMIRDLGVQHAFSASAMSKCFVSVVAWPEAHGQQIVRPRIGWDASVIAIYTWSVEVLSLFAQCQDLWPPGHPLMESKSESTNDISC